MGTITTRKRADGTEGHTVQIRIKRKGVIVHTEAQTFDRPAAAKLWMGKREAELAEPGAIEKLRRPDPPLADVIDHYTRDTNKDFGKTKAQVLAAIKAHKIAKRRCSEITSQDWIEFIDTLKVQPQTAGNYMAHIASVYTVARPAWGYQLDKQVIDDARITAKKLGKISKSNERTRRPTLAELDALFEHLIRRATQAAPLPLIAAFAIFSTRRQGEITRITAHDLDQAHSDVWVRDMKHPGEKLGNDVRVSLPPEAMACARILIRDHHRGGDPRICPYNEESISTAFTRACQFLEIDDLHFHDLRHEGISRLFELGHNIPQVAMVSGHRTWTSLKRYTHLRTTGDKYAGWPWLDKLGITAELALMKAEAARQTTV
jgi:integrase